MEVVSRISCKVFCLTVPEKFVKEPFSASLSSGIETIFASKGTIKIFDRNFVISQYRKAL